MKIKQMTHAIILLSMATSIPLALAQNSVTEKPKVEVVKSVLPGSLAAVIADSVTFVTLTKALKAAELDITLGTKGEYTIFAPTDEAFGKLPASVLTSLLLPENKEQLRSLLLFHVVAGRVAAADLRSGDVKTMNGEKVKINVGTDKVEIDGSKVFSTDVTATNGIMHTIGTVLVPQSLKGFEGLKK